MKKKIIPNIDEFPNKTASEKTVNGCIVLEGGAFRGTYTEGVLDALMQSDINMEATVGVSAGAMNGLNYVSGQIGRSIRVTMKYRHDSRYMGAKALKRNKGLFGFDFMFGELMQLEKFDERRFFECDRRFVAVATNCKTGKAEYFEKNTSQIFEAVKASSSLPFVSQPINIDGTEYFDGGCADKVPYRWAMENGYDKIIVVRTREKSYRKDTSKNGVVSLAEKKFKHYPEFVKSLAGVNAIYNEQCEEMVKLENEGKLFVISPSVKPEVGRFEGDLSVLRDLYYLGYNDTINRIDELKEYLGIE